MTMKVCLYPSFEYEDRFSGMVCGIDEVGRGPLAGPVVAAAVIVPEDIKQHGFVRDITDSKKLTKKKREMLYPSIYEHCHVGLGEASVEEIDEINILQASLLAMSRAYRSLQTDCIHALVDGNKLPHLKCQATPIVKGDGISVSIAAASIIAKVTRDRHMTELDCLHPGYGWASNSGYGAKVHIEALKNLGVTPHHRKSFSPVRLILESESH